MGWKNQPNSKMSRNIFEMSELIKNEPNFFQ